MYCSVGASLVVETQTAPLWLSKNNYNRYCFLQFDQQLGKMIPPEDWKGVRMHIETIIQMFVAYTM